MPATCLLVPDTGSATILNILLVLQEAKQYISVIGATNMPVTKNDG